MTIIFYIMGITDWFQIQGPRKPRTHWRQRRQSPKLVINRRQSPLSTLSPICLQYFRFCRQFVASLSTVDRRRSVDFVYRVAVNIVAEVEHVQLGRLCQKLVIFIAQMSNVLSTLSPACTGPKQHFADFRQSRPCWIRLGHQCEPGFTLQFLSLHIAITDAIYLVHNLIC